MVSPETEALILRLHHAEKWPAGTIAHQLGIHHSVVERVLEEAGISKAACSRPSIVDPFIPFILENLKKYYGAASTTFRKKAGWIQHPPVKRPPPRAKPTSFVGPPGNGENDLLPSPSPTPPDSKRPRSLPARDETEDEFTRKRRRNWARLIARTWLDDPEICPRCGTTMEVLAAISSPAQEDVIEKILRSRGEWDPPWKRPRKIRGPPPSSPGSQGPGGGHPPDDWPEGVDPPHPEFDIDPPFEGG